MYNRYCRFLTGGMNMSILDKIVDKSDKIEIKSLNHIVDKIEDIEEKIQAMTDEELQGMTAIFKDRLNNT